ncbi:type I polyketide synthase [Amycolatopsis anabasis]|uniref:type I polyketide synthase n=1 Tax=Amycolatopsis anabasis TaxID=1840409 RepID=UPI001FE67825|nr:type I polyketide synthase [Amycolatopsis anabasis]
MINAEDLRRWLIERVAEAAFVDEDEVDTGKPLDEYGLSSRDAVELSGALEELLDRTLPTTLLWEHPTIDRLAAALTGEPEAAAPESAAPEAAEPGDPADDPIAVVGLGCRLPGGVTGPDEFWRMLTEGRDAITEVPGERWADYSGYPENTTRWGGFLDDVAGFDAEFFGIAPREAARMDPQQRMVLEVAWEALEHAGIAPEALRGTNTGVFVGISGTEYGALSLANLSDVDAWVGTGAALSIAANRLSYALDLRGPSLATDTACSSSLTAIHLAAQSLRSGESEVALVGGANLLLGPGVTANFDEMGITAPDGKCKPFSADANGMSRAEGVGMVVLKRLSDARADGDRVLALIRGSATNSDGRSNGLTAPNPEAQQALLRTAYQSAGVDPAEVDYVEAHGTGTLLGDPIEARALGAVLGAGRPEDHPLLLGSVKSNVGHLEAAAGIVGLIKTVLALHHGVIPASLNYAGPNPHIAFDELRLSVADTARPWPRAGAPALAGVSGFGFGGTNTHVVLQQATGTPAEAAPRAGRSRFLLGASTPDRLAESAGALAGWLTGDGAEVPLADIDRTLARRLGGRHRAAVVAGDRDELVSALRTLALGEESPAVVTGGPGRPGPGPVFVFSGHGSQWAGMGRKLLAEEPVFAAAIDRLDPLIRAEAGFSLRADLLAGVEATTMDHVQPLVFGLQVALAELLRSYGVRPGAVIGHSFGEVTAAVVAGALAEADGAKIVALRSRLLASLAGDGAMALLEVGAEEAAELVAGLPDVDVAVLTAPRQTVIAGSAEPVRRIVAAVEARGLLAKLVKLDVAAHSPIVDRVTGTLRDGLAGLSTTDTEIRFYSTALADPRETPAFGPGYWARNLRQPVRFAGAVDAALADGYRTFVEVSPHPVLRHALADNLAAHGATDALVVSTLRHCDDEAAHWHGQLGALELAGVAAAPRDGELTGVPSAPWRHERHWLPRAAAPAVPVASGEHPLLGTHVELPDDTKHLWRADLGSAVRPWLAEHRMDGRPVLPSAAFLEMASAAARTVFDLPAEQIVLHDVTLYQPLRLAEHTAVTTTCAPGETGGRVTVHTKASDGTWQLHATAEVSVAERTDAGFCLSEVDDSEFAAVPTAEVYQRLAALGLSYGPAFTGMSEARASTRAGDGRLRAVARVALPEAAGRADQLRLHPALVESCLQVFAAALFDPDADSGTAHMPVEYGAVRVYGDPAQGELVYVSVTEPNERGAGLQGELHLVDGDGRILLEITDVFVRELAHDEIAAPLTEKLLTTSWRPAGIPAHGRPDGPVLVLDRGETAVGAELTELGVDTRRADYRDPDAVAAALAEPAGSVVFLLPGQGADVAALAEAERAMLAVCAVVRRTVEADSSRPARLWLVTTGSAAVTPADSLDAPAFAALRGLVRVLACEHPELRASLVDLDPAAPALESAACLARELASGADDEVAWRAGERHALRLDWVDEPGDGAAPVAYPDGGYLVTGGLGGLGLFIARWLAGNGAGKIVLNGRSAPKPEARRVIDELTASGTEVEVVLGDIAEPGVAESLVRAADTGFTLRGVLHAAAVLDDRTTTRLDADTLHRSWLPKAYGAWRLHEATRDRELDWWIGFSSAAALHGSPGQPAYAAGNAYLDALIAARRAQGLPGTSIAWGTWAEIGAAANLDIPWMHAIRPGEGLAVLAEAIGADRAITGALRLNTPRLASAFPHLLKIPFFEALFGDYAQAAQDRDDWDGVAGLRKLDPAVARNSASAQLRSRVASVLGFAADRLDTVSPLSALGVDSLLAVRIRNAVQHDFELSLPVSLLLRGASVEEAEQWLFGELGIASETPGARPRPVQPPKIGPRDAAERLVASAWRDVLGIEVGVTQDFYGVGGNRQRAEEITALLAERSGRELTISELFEHPTVERMAAHLREEERGGSPLRTLNGRGSKRPLFFFHPGGGDTAVYRQLVQLLDPDVPVYGFDRLEGISSVEDRVRHYLPELRRIQPRGPYRLAGWSFGGFLAYEMAQQLQRAGEQVEIVALIDSIIPLPNTTGLTDVQLTEKRFERFGEFLESSYGRKIELPYERLARLDDEEQVQLLIDTMLAEGLVSSTVSEAILNHQRTSFLDTRSLERYAPGRFDGRVVYFSAAELVPGGLRDHRFDRTDPARGWDAVCTDLEVITIPGHHLSLLDPPNVDQIGKHLDNILATTRYPVGSPW